MQYRGLLGGLSVFLDLLLQLEQEELCLGRDVSRRIA
jgi:hypothetical protein